MLEERANQLWIVPDFGKLSRYARLQFFAFLKWPAGIAGSLGVTPHQFIGIQLRGIAWQKVQRQSALRGGHIGLDDLGLMRRQSVQYQMQRLLTPVQAKQCFMT